MVSRSWLAIVAIFAAVVGGGGGDGGGAAALSDKRWEPQWYREGEIEGRLDAGDKPTLINKCGKWKLLVNEIERGGMLIRTKHGNDKEIF